METRRSILRMMLGLLPACVAGRVFATAETPRASPAIPASGDSASESITISLPIKAEPHWTEKVIDWSVWNRHCWDKKLFLDGVDVTKWCKECNLPHEVTFCSGGKVHRFTGSVLRYDSTADGKGIATPVVLRQIEGDIQIRNRDGSIFWPFPDGRKPISNSSPPVDREVIVRLPPIDGYERHELGRFDPSRGWIVNGEIRHDVLSWTERGSS